jgi:hypothetical protein
MREVKKLLVVFVLALAVPLIAISAPPSPSQIGTGIMGADAGIVAMGGAGVALCDSPYAPFWNPAGLALLKGFHMPFSISARVENIDTIDDWKKLADMADNAKNNQVTLSDVNDARDILGKVKNQTVVAEITPFFAISGNRFAITGYGSVIGQGVVTYYNGPDPDNTAQNLERAQLPIGAYYLYNLCFSIAGGKENHLWGLNVRSIHGRYKGYAAEVDHTYTTDITSGTVVSNTTESPDISSSALGLDYGLLWLGKNGTRYGLMLRNINSPKLFSGEYELKLDMDMDVGIAKLYPNGILAAQWTNALTSGRIDLGGEVRWGILALRAGILDGGFVWGVGLGKGYFRLDVASGKTVKEKVALNFSLF